MAASLPEQIATKVQSEVKRLAPNAVVRSEGVTEDAADIYIYAPRRIADMLGSRANKLKDQLMAGKMLKIRVMTDTFENMSDEAKKKYGIPS